MIQIHNKNSAPKWEPPINHKKSAIYKICLFKMKRKVFAKLIVISLLLIIFKYFLDSSSLFQYDDIVLDTTGHMDLDAEFWLKKNNHSRETNNETNNLVTLIDLRTRLRPKSLYKRIECRKSLMHVVRTTLCVHDIEKDIHVRLIWLWMCFSVLIRTGDVYDFICFNCKGFWVNMEQWDMGRTYFE